MNLNTRCVLAGRIVGLQLALIAMSLLSTPVLAAEHTMDSLETVKKSVAAGDAILLDVREPTEWNSGHLKAAKLAPLSKMRTAKTLAELLKTLPKDKVIYAHCKSGGRCLIAADVLEAEGFQVKALKPGYKELVKAGFESAE